MAPSIFETHVRIFLNNISDSGGQSENRLECVARSHFTTKSHFTWYRVLKPIYNSIDVSE